MNFHAVIWVSFLSLFLQEKKKEERMEEIYYIPLIFFKAYLIFLPAMRMILHLFLY